MTLQTGQQIIAIHILPNILRSKDSQVIKFGQLIKYKNLVQNEVWRLVLDILLFLRKGKSKWSAP